jgi:oligosaccharide repeat unit polymerase
MIPLDLALIIFLLLVVLNYLLHRSVLYPPFIFCTMWLLDLAVVRSGLIEINPVHANTLAIVGAGALSFSFGGLLAGFAPRALLRIHLFPPKPKRMPDSLRTTLMFVLLSGLPLMFYHVWQLSKLVSIDGTVIAQARAAAVDIGNSGESSQSLFVLLYFSSIAMYTSLLFATEKRDRKFRTVTITSLIACILTTGRTDLLTLISGLSAIRLLQKRQESLLGAMRILRWPIAVFVALWIGLIFANKSGQDVTGGAAHIVTNFLLSYVAGPLAAFDSVVQNPANFAMTTSHAFQLPMRIAGMLHLANYTPPPVFDSFVRIPFPINVYTVFKYYFIELSTAGTEALFFIIGLIHSLVYLKAKQGGRLSTYLFACSIYPVLMVIFDDCYYIQGINLRAVAFGLLYLLVGSVHLRLFRTNREPALRNEAICG